MIAQVLPLRAMPRGLDFFTYQVPVVLQNTIQVGQCVKIPFRTQTILGIIAKIEHTSSLGLKEIIEIINPIPLLDQDYLEFLNKLAVFYGVSTSTTIKLALPPLQPTKINHELIEPWRAKLTNTTQAEYAWYHTSAEHQSAYARYASERLLIIVPQKSDLIKIKNTLTPEQQAHCALWSSDMSVKSERDLWFKIRNHALPILIATRSALWLPIHQSFDRIIIDFEHDQNHKHWDQSPRYTAKDLAKMHVRNFGLNYTEMSYSPSVTSYHFIHNKNYLLTTTPTADLPSPRLISPDASFERSPLFRPTIIAIQEALERAPTNDQIFLFNTTAAPKNGVCRDCHEIINTPLPDFCPHCGGQKMQIIGHTINSIAKWLQKEFPNQIVITLNKDTEMMPHSNQGRLIVGTKALCGLIDWQRVSLATILDFTRQALFAEYLNHEDLHHHIRLFQFFLPPTSPLLIQCNSAEHPLLTTLTTDVQWYENELTSRHKLGYPPYSYLVRYLIPGTTESAAMAAAQTVKEHLTARLTKTPKQIMIQGPLLASAKNQSKYWSVLMVKILESDILSAVTWCHQSIPPQAKIDPNPITLTSPH